MRNEQLRKRLLEFVGSSREDLRAFPEDVKDAIGDALLEVPWGSPPDSAKPMHGWGSGVWEIVDNYHTDAYRAVMWFVSRMPCMCCIAFRKSLIGAGSCQSPIVN